MNLNKHILNTKYWKPKFSEIAKETNIPLNTIYDSINKKIQNCEIEVIIKILSKEEAQEKRRIRDNKMSFKEWFKQIPDEFKIEDDVYLKKEHHKYLQTENYKFQEKWKND